MVLKTRDFKKCFYSKYGVDDLDLYDLAEDIVLHKNTHKSVTRTEQRIKKKDRSATTSILQEHYKQNFQLARRTVEKSGEKYYQRIKKLKSL